MEIFDKYIEINGSRQNIMTMRTKAENPILLIVHGGAGLPDRPLVKEYSSELAELLGSAWMRFKLYQGKA